MRFIPLARITTVVALSSIGFTGISTGLAAADAGGGGHVLYSSVVTDPTVNNLPSYGAEAYAFNEFGNEITLGRSNGKGATTNSAVLQLSSWACQSGSWNLGGCTTTPGATYSMPITLNIYNSPAVGSYTPGSLIASVTQTFAVPYRPSSTPDACAGDASEWSNGTTCYHGLLSSVTFKLHAVAVPPTFVYGISYNTSSFGPSPLGHSNPCNSTSAGCFYDSLNIALSQDPTNVSVGTDTQPGTVFQNSSLAGEYCDAGAAGTGTYRLDSPNAPSCWGTTIPYSASPYYVPAIKFMSNSDSTH